MSAESELDQKIDLLLSDIDEIRRSYKLTDKQMTDLVTKRVGDLGEAFENWMQP
jgi:hypothetical protein